MSLLHLKMTLVTLHYLDMLYKLSILYKLSMAISCFYIIRGSPIPKHLPKYAGQTRSFADSCPWSYFSTIVLLLLFFPLFSVLHSCSSSPLVKQNLIKFLRLSLRAILVVEASRPTSPLPPVCQPKILPFLSLHHLLFPLKKRNHSLLFNSYLCMCHSSLSARSKIRSDSSLCLLRTIFVLWKYL